MIKLLFATGALLLGGVLFANAQGAPTTVSQKSPAGMSAVLDILQPNDYGSYNQNQLPNLEYESFGMVLGDPSQIKSPWIFDSIKFTLKFRQNSDTRPTEAYYGIRYVNGEGNAIKGTSEILENYDIDLTGQNPTVMMYKFDSAQTWTVGKDKILLAFGSKDGWLGVDAYYELQYQGGKPILSIPEPSAFGLLAGLGALALVASRRKRRFAK
ncbi:MAG: PEP-CTERM sorting domain-containing protein [Opitutales bacterium]|nr:PEP-CTERM sorting domain-containing protein [Opitutales bacterium]